jgi:hypothetical protein
VRLEQCGVVTSFSKLKVKNNIHFEVISQKSYWKIIYMQYDLKFLPMEMVLITCQIKTAVTNAHRIWSIAK